MSFRSKKEQRNFKKGLNNEEARKKREEVTIELRKSAREEQLNQKRRTLDHSDDQKSSAFTDWKAEIDLKIKNIPMYAEGILSPDLNHQVNCVTQFRKMLSIERNPPIQQVIDSGVVPTLVTLLRHTDNPTLQFEAAWALTNIASGTSRQTRHVIEHGAIPIFAELLKSSNEEVREQAVWALGNIAGDSHTYRDIVLKTGAMDPLLNLVVPEAKPSMLRNGTWCISNFCRGKPQPAFHLVSPAIPKLASLLHSSVDEILTDACWALSYLSDDNGPANSKIQAVIVSGAGPRLVELLTHHNSNVQTPALRTVGNIVTGDDLQTQVILNSQALPALVQLLENPKKSIRKETCWTVSNITAGNPTQIEHVLQAGLIPPLVHLLRFGEFEIQREAAWAVSNATSGGNDAQLRFMAHNGVLHGLSALFKCGDSKVILVALEGIENMLRVGRQDAAQLGSTNKFAEVVEECGGLDSLEELQRHDNQEIYEKAAKILQTFFDTAPAETEALAPQVAEGGTQFAFGMPQGPQTFNYE